MHKSTEFHRLKGLRHEMFNLLFGQKNSALWTAKIGFAKFSDFTNKG